MNESERVEFAILLFVTKLPLILDWEIEEVLTDDLVILDWKIVDEVTLEAMIREPSTSELFTIEALIVELSIVVF